jgi:hypothetical protein
MSQQSVVTKTKKPRIMTFDLLRGYFMISIILNHLQWYPNGYDFVAAQGALHVSAAEGFFFLSGLVLGIVRGRKLISQPFRVAASLLLRRGALLYVTSVLLTFAFMVIGWWFFMDNAGLKPGIRPIDEPLSDVIMGILSLDYLYGWADFLRLYAIFLIATPFALWLVRKGLWWVVLGASFGVWALFPWAFDTSPWSREVLMILSWQPLFFGGFILGYYWEFLTERWSALSARIRKMILYPILVLAVGTILLNIVCEFGQRFGILPEWLSAWYSSISPYFMKERLPLARIVLFLVWFTFGFWLVKKYETPIMKYVGWILVPFGQNSLFI